MNNEAINTQTTHNSTHRKLGLSIVLGLLLIIGGFQAGFVVGQFNPDFQKSDIFLVSEPFAILLMSTGVMTLVFIELNNLAEFHVDKFTVVTLILGSLVGAAAGRTGVLCSPVIGIVNIVLIVILIVKKPNMVRTSSHWTVTGILLGTGAAILLTVVELYVRPAWPPSRLLERPAAGTAVGLILDQFWFVPLEESIFRGFLWGYLRQYGWKENTIIWTQGLLFWLLHFSRLISTPFTFLVIIPALTLIESKLTARSRQLYPSVLVHTIGNTIGGLFNLATF